MLLAAVGNCAGYLGRKVGANSFPAVSWSIDDAVKLEMGNPPSVMFNVLVELLEKGEREKRRAVLKRPSLPMVHMASFGMSLWKSLMCKEDEKEC